MRFAIPFGCFTAVGIDVAHADVRGFGGRAVNRLLSFNNRALRFVCRVPPLQGLSAFAPKGGGFGRILAANVAGSAIAVALAVVFATSLVAVTYPMHTGCGGRAEDQAFDQTTDKDSSSGLVVVHSFGEDDARDRQIRSANQRVHDDPAGASRATRLVAAVVV